MFRKSENESLTNSFTDTVIHWESSWPSPPSKQLWRPAASKPEQTALLGNLKISWQVQPSYFKPLSTCHINGSCNCEFCCSALGHRLAYPKLSKLLWTPRHENKGLSTMGQKPLMMDEVQLMMAFKWVKRVNNVSYGRYAAFFLSVV